MTARLDATGLTRAYGRHLAVHDLSLSLPAGQVIGLLGPNGAGKSTTLRMLAGVLDPDAGERVVDGVRASVDPAGYRARVGYLSERTPLWDDLDVADHLTLAARLHGQGPVDDVLALTELAAVAHAPVRTLSKGWRQRVGLATVLAKRPTVVLLDEPSSGLDPGQRVALQGIVRRLAEAGLTVLLSSHVLAEVEAVCGRALLLAAGRLVADLPVARDPCQLRVRVDQPGLAAAVDGLARVDADGEAWAVVVRSEADVPEVLRRAAALGLREASPARGLEAAYLRAIGQEGA